MIKKSKITNFKKLNNFVGNYYIDEWNHLVFYYYPEKSTFSIDDIIEETEKRCKGKYSIFSISINKLFEEIPIFDERKIFLLKYYNEKLNISEDILDKNKIFDIYIFSFENKDDMFLINLLFK